MIQSTLDFSKRIRDLTTNFIGREWLLREVDDFLQQESEHYLVIIGEPGIGKSAFAAHLTRTRKIHAYHFCTAREAGTLDPIAFVRSLSYQLAHTLPDFASHLIAQEAVKIDASQEIRQMQGGTAYNVYIERLIAQTHSADEAFQHLVREPLKTWALAQPAGRKVILLIDALDEGIRLERHPNIPDLIDSARDLPASVYWLLTSRPGEYFTVFPGKRVVMKDDSTKNIEDVREYVGKMLAETPKATDSDTAALRDKLVQHSSGNFLYLYYLLSALREDNDSRQLSAIPDRLPVGLDGVYREFLDRWLKYKTKDEWHQIYRPVLGVLTVVREALDFATLVNLSGVGAQEVSDTISALSQFLDILDEDASIRYRIYHTSFADFLNDRDRNPNYWIDPRYYHRRIADYYLGKHAESWAGCDEYGLRYLPVHMTEAGYRDELYRLLTASPDWMEAKFTNYNSNIAYVDDLELALMDFADPLTSSQLAALSQFHAARQVVHGKADFYTDNDLRTLVWLGRGIEAENYAHLRADPTRMFWALFVVYEAMRQKNILRPDLLEDARIAIRAIEDDEEKLAALAQIAVALAAVVREADLEAALMELKQVAHLVPGNWWSSLIEVGIKLDQIGYKDLASDILAEVRRNTKEEMPWSTELLIELGRALLHIGRASEAGALLNEVHQVAGTPEKEHNRLQILMDLATAFAQTGLEDSADDVLSEVNQLINIDRDPASQVAGLIDLARTLAEIGRGEHIDDVLKGVNRLLDDIEGPVQRVSVLINLATLLARVGRKEQAHTALQEAKRILLDSPYDSHDEPAPFENSQKSEVMRKLTEVLAQTGLFEEARQVALSINEKRVRSESLRVWVEASARAGRLPDAEQVAQAIDDIQVRARALEFLSMIRADLHQFKDAERIAHSIDTDYMRAAALSYLSATLAFDGKKAEASLHFTELEKNARHIFNPEHRSWALLHVARVLANNNYTEKANVVLVWARQSANFIYDSQRRDKFLIELVATLAQQGLFTEAKKAADAIHSYLNQASALQYLALALAGAGKSSEAGAVFREAMATLDVPNDHPYFRAAGLMQIAVAAVQAGCQDESQTILAEAKRVTWLSLQFMTLGNLALHEWILTLIQIGNFIEAGEIASNLSAGYYRAEALIELAEALSRAGHRAEAWEAFEKSWDAARSSSPSELIHLTRTLFQAGYEKEARAALAEAVEVIHTLQPGHDSPDVNLANQLIHLAEAFTEAGCNKDARSIFEEAERSISAFGDLYSAQRWGHLSSALARAGYFDDAKKAFFAIALRERNFPRSLYLPNLAIEFAKSQRFCEAFTLLDQSEGDLDQFLQSLAEWSPAFERAGPGLAITILREALRIAGWICPDWQEIYDLIHSRP